MPSTYTYPGVYVEEIPSGVRTITGVSTADTAFIGFFARGPMNDPVRITSFGDFVRRFGGLDTRSEASYAIQQYYLNGGQIAWVVRVASGNPQPAVLGLEGGSPLDTVLEIAASSPGLWGKNVQVAIGYINGQPDRFNLVAREVGIVGGRRQVVNSEIHRNLSLNASSPRYVASVINEESSLISVTGVGMGGIPNETDPTVADVTSAAVIGDVDSTAFVFLGDDPDDPALATSDGALPDSNALITGMNTLDTIAPFIFNLLCLPDAANLAEDAMRGVYSAANTYCESKRAFLLVDIPADIDAPDEMTDDWLASVGNSIRHRNAAVYFPRLEIPDLLSGSRPRNVAASGTLAGVYARTDATRGVWKAPAGTEATLRGATLVANITDLQNGALNQLGVNALRTFPVVGNVSWGGRTLDGADQQASEWKYIPVRRLALYIEESLFQGLKWVVFEPNDEPLWAQIRLNVGAFMQNLFRQGAFQGKTPREAYFVKCDKETTIQDDINRGIVNIIVGFAPLKPAEFVVIKIQQMAGQLEV
ncbi:MAG: phage tail sheath family protein [Chloroflexi bacterium]|nr:phage tail sheath family protein [Chloroflexota bacterium]MCI0575352.1 phage tail sheath family protein [Chloroflexota bacterium]MCI0645826.1 phage tail sheath family protein [Chloroflexota bacterium]MCI0730962.1 phage tail sheath family protein [Chloroflexota bacterium]